MGRIAVRLVVLPALLAGLALVAGAGGRLPDDDPSTAAAKLSPDLRDRAAAATGSVRALVELKAGAALPGVPGIRYSSRAGRVLTARVPAVRLLDLAASPSVARIESPVTMHRMTDMSGGSTIGFRETVGGSVFTFQGQAGETLTFATFAEGGAASFTITPQPPDVATPSAGTGPGGDGVLVFTPVASGAITITLAGTVPCTLTIRSTARVLGSGLLTGGSIAPGAGPFHLGTGADVARTAEGLSGSGVIVGIVDSGIDWNNADFLSSATTTRILSIWDQTLSAQPQELKPSGFDYGVEYSQLQMENELAGLLTAGYVRTTDAGGHGTAVAGVAAGDGSNGLFTGLAPAANLIVVKTTGSSDTVIDAVNYVRTRAQALGRPCVVNLSLGTHDGPHDGTSIIDQAMNSFGNTPGFAIVAAAGNEGSTAGGAIHDRMVRGLFTSGVFTYVPDLGTTSAPDLVEHVVISEIGHNLALSSQFVELYNPSDKAVSVAAWTISHKPPTLGYTLVTTLPSGASIAPFGYYLVGGTTTSAVGSGVAPDHIVAGGSGMNLGIGSGTVRLDDDAGTEVDRVAWGLGDDPEGLAATASAAGGSIERLPGAASPTGGNGTDSGDNSLDFATRVTAEQQNSSSAGEQPGIPHVIDIWCDPTDTYAITVSDGTPAGTFTVGDASEDEISPIAPIREYKVKNRMDSPSNGATHIRVTLVHVGPLPASWTLTMTRLSGAGGGVVHAYSANDIGGFTALNIALNADGSVPGSVAEPGTSAGVITVGSYVSKFKFASDGGTVTQTGSLMGAISTFSSRGPTRDGRIKPDLAAPGQVIGTSRDPAVAFPATETAGGGVVVFSTGTSFSAPQVTGAIALLFHRNANLTPSIVRSTLIATIFRDDQTGAALPDNTWGAGKLNGGGLVQAFPPQVVKRSSNPQCSITTAATGRGRPVLLLLSLAALALLALPLLRSNPS